MQRYVPNTTNKDKNTEIWILLILPSLLWRNVHLLIFSSMRPLVASGEKPKAFFKLEYNSNFDNILQKKYIVVFQPIWQPYHLPGWWRWNEGGHFSETMIEERPTETSRFEDCLCERMHKTSFSIQEASWSCHYQQRLLQSIKSISVSVFNTFSLGHSILLHRT